MDKQASTFALSLMQQQEGFDPKKMYDFAAASGQITKEAAEQYKAYDKITKALGENKITADQANKAVQAVTGDLTALDGLTVETYIDLFIRQHGSIDYETLTGGVNRS